MIALIRSAGLIAARLLASAHFAHARGDVTWMFERDSVGKVPAGFREEVGKWRVVAVEGKSPGPAG
jgi:hypothetical protein